MRFLPGDVVLVRRTLGGCCEPFKIGVVERIFGAGSVVFDYVIKVGTRRYEVQDGWLAPQSTTIYEFQLDVPSVAQ